jgi:hypothetical protein
MNKIMKTLFKLTIAIILVSLFACSEDELIMETNDELILKSAEIAEDDMMAESVMEEFNYEVSFFAESEKLLRQLANFKGSKNLIHGNMGMRYKGENNPNVSIEIGENEYPITITIDYGESTTLKNGRVISGLVTIEVSAPRGTDGATRTITYTNCVIDSVQIDGFASDTFNGDNETTRLVSTTSNLTLVLADGTILERTGNHVREWLSGLETPMDYSDDRISVNGTVTFDSSNGNVWTRDIIEPLIKVSDCRHPVQGVVQFTENGTILATLNYGNGECDNLAILTVDGEEVEIELQGRKPDARVEKYRERANNKRGGK